MVRRLVGLARWGLIALAVGGGGLAVWIIVGGDQPAARLTFALDSASSLDADRAIPLPADGFTLIAEVEIGNVQEACTPPTGLRCAWGLTFYAPDGTPVYTVTITGDGYFRLTPPLPDSTAFIHLNTAAPNQVQLTWAISGRAELRLNRETAWQGILPAAHTAQLTLNGGDLRGVWVYSTASR